MNILKITNAKTIFGDALQEERNKWQREQEEIQKYENHAAAEEEREPETVKKFEFYSARTLKNILNEVVEKFLPENALLKQLDSLKTTKNPQKIHCKTWLNCINKLQFFCISYHQRTTS